ncbi:oxygen-evolving enhancer protein 1, chloroplastic-like [Macadamia integrifolia]|uniref:oxygen-evolving enhancer protein 1, chloroplastic-like n=1 Tax=Macadamia integrifolia TaxID=60698 RepID=UPI001C4FA830|nr:oxygen-evolving enhancer protein 1, chloroplastic-like [Macadamia integrifolia]
MLGANIFQRQAKGVSKTTTPKFQKMKLMTRMTYNKIEGPFEVSLDDTIKFVEKDGIDSTAVTVQLPGGELLPFLFTIKQLMALANPENHCTVFGLRNFLMSKIYLTTSFQEAFKLTSQDGRDRSASSSLSIMLDRRGGDRSVSSSPSLSPSSW